MQPLSLVKSEEIGFLLMSHSKYCQVYKNDLMCLTSINNSLQNQKHILSGGYVNQYPNIIIYRKHDHLQYLHCTCLLVWETPFGRPRKPKNSLDTAHLSKPQQHTPDGITAIGQKKKHRQHECGQQ